MMLRPEMGWRPVTSKFWRKEDSCGNVTPDEPVLKMLRQPRTVLAAVPGSTVHPREPIYSRLLAKAMFSWSPSVMGLCAPAVRADVLMTVNTPQREIGQPATGGGCGGVPADRKSTRLN